MKNKILLIFGILVFLIDVNAQPCGNYKVLKGKVELPSNSVVLYQNLQAQLYSSGDKPTSEKFPVNADGEFEIKYKGTGSRIYVFDKNNVGDNSNHALLLGNFNKKRTSIVNVEKTAEHILYAHSRKNTTVGNLIPKYSRDSIKTYTELVDVQVMNLAKSFHEYFTQPKSENRSISSYSKNNVTYNDIISNLNVQVENALNDGELQYSQEYIFHQTVTQEEIESLIEKLVTCQINQSDMTNDLFMKIDYIMKNEFEPEDETSLNSKNISIKNLHLFSANLERFYMSSIGEIDRSKSNIRVKQTSGYAAVLNADVETITNQINSSIDTIQECTDDCYEETLSYAKTTNKEYSLFIGKKESKTFLGCISPKR